MSGSAVQESGHLLKIGREFIYLCILCFRVIFLFRRCEEEDVEMGDDAMLVLTKIGEIDHVIG